MQGFPERSSVQMATPNPMKATYPGLVSTVPKKRCTVSGIITTVYGLEELPGDVTEVVCLWLLHPRLQTHSCMEPVAASATQGWNTELQRMKETGHRFGLIAVSFDQRNHGSREVDALANEAWRSGNKSHAPDMLGIYRWNKILAEYVMLRALTRSRWYCKGCFPADDLHLVLHFPQSESNNCRPYGVGCFARWACGLALCSP